MSMLPTFKSDRYDDGRTKQAFVESTDINKILAKAQRGGTISHLAKHGAMYGDFSDIDDLLSAHKRLERGQAIFDELPSEVRKEFMNDLGAFYRYVTDPANAERLQELLPDLARPGRQMVAVRRTVANTESSVPAGPVASPSAGSVPAGAGDTPASNP